MISKQSALNLVRRMSGMDKYPFHPQAEAVLVEALAEISESEEEARDAVDSFDGECPCPNRYQLQRAVLQVRDAAESERRRKEGIPDPESIREWEQKYGPPAPAIQGTVENPHGICTCSDNCLCNGKSFEHILRDTKANESGDRKIMLEVAKKLGEKTLTGVTWRTVYLTMRELGYPLNSEQEKMAGLR